MNDEKKNYTAVEAERAVIGAILLDNHAIYEAGPLDKKYFSDSHLGTILEAIRQVIHGGARADLITVCDALRKAGQLEAVGGSAAVSRLTSEVPTSANIRYYADIMREENARRRLLGKLEELKAKLARPNAAPGDLRAELAEEMRTLYAPETDRRPLGDVMKEKFERDAERDPGILLGMPLGRFEYLGKMLDGIREGLYIAAAETNIGKTAFLANIFLDLLKANPLAIGLYVSLDDSRDVIIDRFTTILSRLAWKQAHGEFPDVRDTITINALRSNLDNRPSIKAAKAEAERTLIDMAEAGRLDVRDALEISSKAALEGLIREKASAGDPLIVMVDALFNLSVGEEDREASIREQNIDRANFLKGLSSEFHIPIWTTAELRKRQPKSEPRDATAKEGPTVDEIMETGKYSYNANVVMMLYPENMEEFFDKADPWLIIDVQKNKLSDFKKRLAVKFVKASATMEPLGTIYHYLKPQKEEKAKAGKNGKEEAGARAGESGGVHGL